jgi:hypothetical protein
MNKPLKILLIACLAVASFVVGYAIMDHFYQPRYPVRGPHPWERHNPGALACLRDSTCAH